jgi:ribosomal protein S18 acetylase RimI-like enzyme
MSSLTYRLANLDDVALLAAMNLELIQDEGHRNPMNTSQLAERMAGWLGSHEYWAVLFFQNGVCVAYALLKDEIQDTYLRHFFVVRECRRQGIGRAAIDLLFREIVSPDKPVRLDVLSSNERGHEFWRAVGFTDYSVTLIRHGS